MDALVVRDLKAGWQEMAVERRPVPQPGPGQVLVRVVRSPVHPADLYMTQGAYGIRAEPPFVPGLEGVGIVVSAGPGASAPPEGSRVAFLSDSSGAWAQYALARAVHCAVLPDGLAAAQVGLVNPLTAVALLAEAGRMGTPALIQTAAAGQVGRMIGRLCRARGIGVIDVVRRAAPADALIAEGASRVIVTADEGWDAVLRTAAQETGAALALDAVAGQVTGRLAAALPRGGRVIVYGALALSPCHVVASDLVFGGKSVSGFWVADWLGGAGRDGAWRRELDWAGDTFLCAVRAEVPMAAAGAAIAGYLTDMTAGKVSIAPNGP